MNRNSTNYLPSFYKFTTILNSYPPIHLLSIIMSFYRKQISWQKSKYFPILIKPFFPPKNVWNMSLALKINSWTLLINSKGRKEKFFLPPSVLSPICSSFLTFWSLFSFHFKVNSSLKVLVWYFAKILSLFS